MARRNYSIKIKNAAKIRKMLAPTPLLAGPWRAALEEAGELGHDVAERRVPYLTGKTQRGLKLKVSTAKIPLWARIDSTARRTRGGGKRMPFDYPRLLNYSPRSKYPEWMTGVPALIQGKINGILEKAARGIEHAFQKGTAA